jgi:hypothetical protein
MTKQKKSTQEATGAIEAELSKPNGRGIQTLTAECPKCGSIDGHTSTGHHSESGKDKVKCCICGNEFYIYWGKGDGWNLELDNWDYLELDWDIKTGEKQGKK